MMYRVDWGDILSITGAVAAIAAVAWLFLWMIVGMITYSHVQYETCPSGAKYEQGLRDWHRVGVWPIAVDYTCGDWR